MELSNATADYHPILHLTKSYLWETLEHSVYWRVLFTVVAILLTTRVFSTLKYRQSISSKAPNRTPPTLPYWVPFLRHAFSMGWNSNRFVARCL